jgi:hypothetical protein
MRYQHPQITRSLSLLLAAAGMAAASAGAAAEYAVVPGSADNSVHLAIECPAEWSVDAELVSRPTWVSRAQLAFTSGANGADVYVAFDVDSAASVGKRGALVLAVKARDAHGQRVAGTLRRLPLRLEATAPSIQRSYQIEDCCVPTAGIGGAQSGRPRRAVLLGAVPNPWAALTTIRFGLHDAASVSLRIMDVAGRVVYQIRTPELEPGYHQVSWDGRNPSGQPVSPGLYFYELSAGAWLAAGKTLLLH